MGVEDGGPLATLLAEAGPAEAAIKSRWQHDAVPPWRRVAPKRRRRGSSDKSGPRPLGTICCGLRPMAPRPLPRRLRARSAFLVAKLRLRTKVVIAPADDGAAPDQLEIARRAYAVRVLVPLRQAKQTQHGLPTRRAERSNEVGVVPAQGVSSWPGVPKRKGESRRRGGGRWARRCCTSCHSAQ